MLAVEGAGDRFNQDGERGNASRTGCLQALLNYCGLLREWH
jgi:hypothetical protein